MADAVMTYEDLEEEVSRLKDDKRKLNKELKALGSSIKDATARAEKAERAMHEAEDKLKELSAGLLSSEELDELQKRAEQGAIDAEELKKIREQLAGQEDLEKKIAEAKEEIEKQKKAAKDALKIAEDSKKLADTANEQLQKKQAELEEKIKELTEVYTKLAKAEDLVANYEVQIKENYKIVEGYVKELAEAKKALEDYERTQEELKKARAQISDYEYTAESDKKILEKLKERVEKAQEAKEEALKESTELRRQKGEAEALVETLKTNIALAEAAKIEAEKIARESLIARMAGAVVAGASTSTTDPKDEEIKRLQKLAEDTQKGFAGVKGKYDATRKSYRETSAKLAELEKSAGESAEKLKESQDKLEEVRLANAASAVEIKNLTAANAGLTSQVTAFKPDSLEAKVVKLVYEGFKVAQNEKKSGKNLFNAEKKAKSKDKDAQDAYDKQVRKAKKKGSTVLDELQLPNDGYTKIVEAIVEKYHEYLATNSYTDEEERAYESRLLGTTVDADADRNKVATEVVAKILEKETQSIKTQRKALKIALPSAATVLAGFLILAIVLGVGKAGVEAELVDANNDNQDLISWSELDTSLGELSGNDIYGIIEQAYGSLQTADGQADKIQSIFSPKTTSAQGYSKVGSVIYATTSSENATDYLRVKNAVSVGNEIKTNADAVLSEYQTAMQGYATAKQAGDIETAKTYLETAETANTTLTTYKENMSTQVKEAEVGINELLVLAGMTMEEVEYVYSLMISPVLYVDIDEQQLLNNNTLFTNNDNGRALSVLSCAYDKKTNKVNMIVECMGANRQKYFNYVTFKTENEYSVIDQYELIDEMKEATTRSTAYDRELETDIQGTTVKANINGVDVEGIVDMKWSLSKKVDKKSGTVTVNGSALIVLTNEAGEFVSFQMIDVKKDFSTSDSSAEMEETIKQMLLEQINKELGTNASLIDDAENENA